MATNCVGDLAVLNDGTVAHGEYRAQTSDCFFSSFPILFRSAVPVAIATVFSGKFRYNQRSDANFNFRSLRREKDATRECAKRTTRKTHSFAFVRETVELNSGRSNHQNDEASDATFSVFLFFFFGETRRKKFG